MMEEARLLARSTALSSVGLETSATCGHQSLDKASTSLLEQPPTFSIFLLQSDYFELTKAKASRERTTFTFLTN